MLPGCIWHSVDLKEGKQFLPAGPVASGSCHCGYPIASNGSPPSVPPLVLAGWGQKFIFFLIKDDDYASKAKNFFRREEELSEAP